MALLWTQIASATLYLWGCFLLLPATGFLFFPSQSQAAIALFVAACATLVFAALIDVGAVLFPFFTGSDNYGGSREEMQTPLVVVRTPRPSVSLSTLVIVLSYLAGGLLFLVGSILFWPGLGTTVQGVWVFRAGSVAYLIGSTILLLMIWSGKRWIHIWSIIIYSIGSVSYIAGGALSQLGLSSYIYVWVVGAVCFFIGALLGFVKTIGS